MGERLSQSLDITRSREQVDPSKVRVMLVNMEGEKDQSLHEPIGLEAIGGKLKKDTPELTLRMLDTQPELVQTGKLHTDRLAANIRDFVNEAPPGQTAIIGFGVPIYSWAYTEAVLIKLEQDPPENPPEIVLGNAIPTYTNPKLLKERFPHVKLVVGEGEKVFSDMVRKVSRGEPIEDNLEFNPPTLKEDYALPLRVFTQDILDLGGSAKAEASRGCDFGACTFCSRCLRSGKDYRTVQEEAVVGQVTQLLEEFNVTRFELTDEEAFGDLKATERLVGVMKSADLPRVPFTASLRVETLNNLHDSGLLEQLREVGLDKVFLGVEGGSDRFLQHMAKGQKMEEVAAAIEHVKESVYVDPKTEKEKPLEMEMGFITFSWRMDMEMLRDNIEFLSAEGNAPYVSSLFNQLEVRAGTIDEKLLRRYVANRSEYLSDTTSKKPGWEYESLDGYDPDKRFSINNSYYEDVPFLDPEVGRIFKDVQHFARGDEQLYYAIKSITRAKSLPPELHEKAREFYLGMKSLHLRYLRNAVGLDDFPDVPAQRRALVEDMQDTFGIEPQHDALNGVRREIKIFLSEDEERDTATGDQVGALAVCFDDQGRMLLVRPRGEEQWAFPGGNVKDDESLGKALSREVKEELGVTVTLERDLPTYEKEDHVDRTTGRRPRLTLHHFLTSMEGEVDHIQGDHEIVDTLWLEPAEILNERVQTRENVQMIAHTITTEARHANGAVTVFPG